MSHEELEKLAADVKKLSKLTGASPQERMIASVVVRLVKLLAPYLETM